MRLNSQLSTIVTRIVTPHAHCLSVIVETSLLDAATPIDIQGIAQQVFEGRGISRHLSPIRGFHIYRRRYILFDHPHASTYIHNYLCITDPSPSGPPSTLSSSASASALFLYDGTPQRLYSPAIVLAATSITPFLPPRKQSRRHLI